MLRQPAANAGLSDHPYEPYAQAAVFPNQRAIPLWYVTVFPLPNIIALSFAVLLILSLPNIEGQEPLLVLVEPTTTHSSQFDTVLRYQSTVFHIDPVAVSILLLPTTVALCPLTVLFEPIANAPVPDNEFTKPKFIFLTTVSIATPITPLPSAIIILLERLAARPVTLAPIIVFAAPVITQSAVLNQSTVLFEPDTLCHKLFIPIAVLPVPVVLPNNAPRPNAELNCPVVLEYNDDCHTAVLREPVVFNCSAIVPIAVLPVPVVLLYSAFIPFAVLS